MLPTAMHMAASGHGCTWQTLTGIMLPRTTPLTSSFVLYVKPALKPSERSALCSPADPGRSCVKVAASHRTVPDLWES